MSRVAALAERAVERDEPCLAGMRAVVGPLRERAADWGRLRSVSTDSGVLLAERLQTALDLFEAGEQLMRENLRRQHPKAGEAEIERRLVAWLRERPGAEHGDAPGRVIRWPRGT